MLRRANEIIGYTIEATDGSAGSLDDLYFDDREWTVRLLVVETGGWLTRDRVVLAPDRKITPNASRGAIEFPLTKESIENAPNPGAESPMDEEEQTELFAYYAWPPYWGQGLSMSRPAPLAGTLPVNAIEKKTAELRGEGVEDEVQPHLRSAREMVGFDIAAADGEIGHAEDLLIEDESWTIRYLAIDTRNWMPGRKVLIHPDWIERPDWPAKKIRVKLTREQVENSPPLTKADTIERDYEQKIFDYYGYPGYWV